VTLFTVATFLAILAVLAAVADLVLIAVATLVGGPARRALRSAIGPYAVAMAAIVAATAMAGSLYFSEVGHLEPCVLCWYQRIAMYALAVILAVAAVRRDVGVRPYVVALAGIGGLISAYHILVQRLPGLPSGSCSLTAPCSAIQVEVFGVITIPVLALIGFVSVLTLMTVAVGRGDGMRS
jgi:disulfide bond formation protein DsbB